MTKRLLFLFVVCASLLASRNGFGQCPPPDVDGAWTGPISLAFTASDGCVDTVFYCYRRVIRTSNPLGYEDQYFISAFSLGPCPNNGHNMLGDEDILHQGANVIFGTITDNPDCDGGVTYSVVQIALASCYFVNGAAPFVATACGSGTCTRICDYCWQWVAGHHVANPTNCTYNDTYTGGCASLPPGQTLFTVTTSGCYHLQCSPGW